MITHSLVLHRTQYKTPNFPILTCSVMCYTIIIIISRAHLKGRTLSSLKSLVYWKNLLHVLIFTQSCYYENTNTSLPLETCLFSPIYVLCSNALSTCCDCNRCFIFLLSFSLYISLHQTKSNNITHDKLLFSLLKLSQMESAKEIDIFLL